MGKIINVTFTAIILKTMILASVRLVNRIKIFQFFNFQFFLLFLQVANIIFRKSRSNIICILHGAFDSSAVMLLIFKASHHLLFLFNFSGITSVFCILNTSSPVSLYNF